jgi:hypothetical protein
MKRFSLKSVLTLATGSVLTLPSVFAAGEISGALFTVIDTIKDLFGNIAPQLADIAIYRFLYWIIVFALARYIFKFFVFKGGDGEQAKAKNNLAVTLAVVIATIGAVMTPENILTFIFTLYSGLLSLIFVLFVLGLLLAMVYSNNFLPHNHRLRHFTRAALIALCLFALTFVRDLYAGGY